MRQRFHHERSILESQLEEQRAELNRTLNRTDGNSQLTQEQVVEHTQGHPDAYSWSQTFARDLQRLRSIDHEMNSFIPSPEQVAAFVRYEFGSCNGYLSYFRGGGGALEAIARIKGIEVSVFTGDSDLVQTLHVPATPGNMDKFFLHHVGGVDGQKTAYLNHFNILYEVQNQDVRI